MQQPLAPPGKPLRGAAPIVLVGEFDVARAVELQRALGAPAPGEFLVIDCRAVTAVDASALGCFVRLKKSLPNTTIRLVGIAPRIAMLFRMTQIDVLFEMCPRA